VYENQNNNIDNDGSAIYFELYSTTDGGFANPSAAEARIFDFGNGWLGQDRTTGAARLSDATNTVTGPVINEGANQIGVVWSTTDNQMAICVNGVWSTDSAYDGTMTGVANIKIGINLDHCVGIRLGKGYVGIADLAAGKDIIDGLM
ncbi:MAG: hypothetical protein WBN07_05655, partial [Woeseiaceae bacterium]